MGRGIATYCMQTTVALDVTVTYNFLIIHVCTCIEAPPSLVNISEIYLPVD